jgi:hypothetical protein
MKQKQSQQSTGLPGTHHLNLKFDDRWPSMLQHKSAPAQQLQVQLPDKHTQTNTHTHKHTHRQSHSNTHSHTYKHFNTPDEAATINDAWCTSVGWSSRDSAEGVRSKYRALAPQAVAEKTKCTTSAHHQAWDCGESRL